MNAGMARKKRKRIVSRFCRTGGSIATSISYEPSLPVKPGNLRPMTYTNAKRCTV
jgi:hypothetical protein